MRRRDFMGWLAVLPFLRKLPKLEPSKASARRMLISVKNPDSFTPFPEGARYFAGVRYDAKNAELDADGRVQRIRAVPLYVTDDGVFINADGSALR